MRKIREVLRLKFEVGLSARQVAISLQVGRASVGEYLNRFAASGLTWPSALTDAELQRHLFPPPPAVPSDQRPVPDWAHVHAELRRPGVTLALLWQEYRLAHPQGFQYSWFCEHYRLWAAKVDVVMRQEHRAGEKLFVDYAGQTVPIIDRRTGEIRQAQIFVAVLGASSYTFTEATWSQKLPDWLGSHARCFAFSAAPHRSWCPTICAVASPRHIATSPTSTPVTAIWPSITAWPCCPLARANPRTKPRSKSACKWSSGGSWRVLRNRQFFSLSELNTAIGVLLDRLNQRPFKKLPGSRRSAFEAIDHPALQPLPEHPYVYAEWKKVRVHIDYHVEVDGHFYSVPYQLVKHQLEVRLTAQTVECFHANQRVASHLRSPHKGRHTTQTEHMPKSHREHAEWTPQRLIRWAEQTGPNTAGVIAHILERRIHRSTASAPAWASCA
ncbi:IS21 family transposase [Pseudomonas corrugata]